MNAGRTIFSQLMDFLSPYEFRKCVDRYGGNYKIKSFTCWDQFLAMAFAQLTYRESLRDIEACLRANHIKLYHMGIRSKIARNTLAHANETRDWRIYLDFAKVLIDEARRLYADEDLGLQLDQTAYALDATTIDLCLSLFPWAKFRKAKDAIRLHTLMDLRGSIPTMIVVSHGKIHETSILKLMTFEPGAIYVMDRGYVDFTSLYRIDQSSAFFVVRCKNALRFKRRYSHPIDKATGLQSDQTVVLTTFYPRKNYPDALRRVRYRDPETGVLYTFLAALLLKSDSCLFG